MLLKMRMMGVLAVVGGKSSMPVISILDSDKMNSLQTRSRASRCSDDCCGISPSRCLISASCEAQRQSTQKASGESMFALVGTNPARCTGVRHRSREMGSADLKNNDPLHSWEYACDYFEAVRKAFSSTLQSRDIAENARLWRVELRPTATSRAVSK